LEEGVVDAAVAGQGPEGRRGGGRAVAEGDPDGGAVPAVGLLRGHLLRRRGPPPRAPAAAAVAHAQPAPDAAQARRQRRQVLAPARTETQQACSVFYFSEMGWLVIGSKRWRQACSVFLFFSFLFLLGLKQSK
jgi:hypothetical protein